ncbi:hypothetical protein IEQ34_007223 [Dendrobium chrysotoxum]|uniref:Cytochrome P450 n=1 Tax=Dendrobium chrysotoxum TaxID=161865 RepID=A0AAV7H7N9_DENCH|nr:hypothetical protein IEQ34_007223 [Dendrobium chrysotoxum]
MWLICFLHGVLLVKLLDWSEFTRKWMEHERKKWDVDDTNEDFIDVLLRIKRIGEMDLSLMMENVKAVILDLFLARSDTSSTLLVWTMRELIRQPKVRKALNGKIRIEEGYICKFPYLNQLIKETLDYTLVSLSWCLDYVMRQLNWLAIQF